VNKVSELLKLVEFIKKKRNKFDVSVVTSFLKKEYSGCDFHVEFQIQGVSKDVPDKLRVIVRTDCRDKEEISKNLLKFLDVYKSDFKDVEVKVL